MCTRAHTAREEIHSCRNTEAETRERQLVAENRSAWGCRAQVPGQEAGASLPSGEVMCGSEARLLASVPVLPWDLWARTPGVCACGEGGVRRPSAQDEPLRARGGWAGRVASGLGHRVSCSERRGLPDGRQGIVSQEGEWREGRQERRHTLCPNILSALGYTEGLLSEGGPSQPARRGLVSQAAAAFFLFGKTVFRSLLFSPSLWLG